MENIDIVEKDVLNGHNKKSMFKSGILGFFIGLAVIVPGVSGSTIAIIFRLYNHLLYCLSNLFKRFIKCLLFLLPIIVGAFVGVVFGFITIKQMLNFLPFATVALFIGLMAGAYPGVKDEAKGISTTKTLWLLFIIGLIIPIAISISSNFITDSSSLSNNSLKVVENFNIFKAILFVFLGYVVAITQIVPGLSATAILMAFGYFTPLLNSVSMTFWKANPMIFAVYGCLIVGFVLGLITFSKLLSNLFKIAKDSTWFVILGLSLGSIISMAISPDMISVYKSWANGGIMVGVDIISGLLLCALGVFIGYSLVKYERIKNSNNIKR